MVTLERRFNLVNDQGLNFSMFKLRVCACVLGINVCAGQRTTSRCQFSPSRDSEMKLRFLGIMASTVAHWTISLAPRTQFLTNSLNAILSSFSLIHTWNLFCRDWRAPGTSFPPRPHLIRLHFPPNHSWVLVAQTRLSLATSLFFLRSL